MKAINELEKCGYMFTLDGGTIRYALTGTQPEPAAVRRLLCELKAHKDEALAFLKRRAEKMQPDPTAGFCRVVGDDDSWLQMWVTPEHERRYQALYGGDVPDGSQKDTNG